MVEGYEVSTVGGSSLRQMVSVRFLLQWYQMRVWSVRVVRCVFRFVCARRDLTVFDGGG